MFQTFPNHQPNINCQCGLQMGSIWILRESSTQASAPGESIQHGTTRIAGTHGDQPWNLNTEQVAHMLDP